MSNVRAMDASEGQNIAVVLFGETHWSTGRCRFRQPQAGEVMVKATVIRKDRVRHQPDGRPWFLVVRAGKQEASGYFRGNALFARWAS